jgi:hypothetical protein
MDDADEQKVDEKVIALDRMPNRVKLGWAHPLSLFELGRLLFYQDASEGDDLATLGQGDPMTLKGCESLRNIKLNQSCHNETSQDEHLHFLSWYIA